MNKQILSTLAIALLTASGVYYTTLQQPLNQDSQIVQFEQWKQAHGRKYASSEDKYRFEIFNKNYEIVHAHNQRYEAGLETFELGLNNFADLTTQEFEDKYLAPMTRQSPKGLMSVSHPVNQQVPSEVDHRTSGIVSTVKDQGSCGACWAFSAVGSLESALRQSGVSGVELSEQEFVDCVRDGDYESIGCDGGFSREAIHYTTQNGVAIRSQYEYTATDGKCKRDQTTIRHKVKEYVRVKQNDATAFVQALANKPISVAINASGIYFQLYKKGIYSRKCDGAEELLNHEVVAVGYGTDHYIIKNSWGSSWGDAGYIKFARIQAPEGQCGVHQEAGFPIV